MYNEEFLVVRGREFFIDGRIVFPIEPKQVDRYYYTFTGPCIDAELDVQGRTDHNIALAMNRLFNTRKPLEVGFHQRLQRNQIQFAQEHMQAFSKIARDYAPFFDAFVDYYHEIQEHYQDPHEKKAARIHAWDELRASGRAHLLLDDWLKLYKTQRGTYLTAQFKLEYAKALKKGRMIMNLRTEASLRGFRPCEFMKAAQAGVHIEYRGGIAIFCKSPDREKLREYFQMLERPTYRFVYLYFSDDAVLGYWRDGRVCWHNIDISSCDASHTQAVFDTLLTLVPRHMLDEFKALVKQCRGNFRVHSEYYHKWYVEFKPLFARLYSGSTLTTLINNIANQMIMMAVGDLPVIGAEFLENAAASAGYVITGTQELTRFEEVQFLKHSPVFDGHEYKPFLNPGVLFRLMGRCKMDLPGRGPLPGRARAFAAALLKGAYPYVHSPFLHAFRSNLYRGDTIFERDRKLIRKHASLQLRYKVGEESQTGLVTGNVKDRWEFKDEDIFKRYALSPGEVSEILWVVKTIQYGQFYSSPTFSKILQMDYNMGCAVIKDVTKITPAGLMWPARSH